MTNKRHIHFPESARLSRLQLNEMTGRVKPSVADIAYSFVRKVKTINFKNFPLWLLPLALGLLFFRLSGVETEPDSAWYTALAMSLQQGLGFRGPNWETVFRAPVFPAMLTVVFSVLGTSVKTANP